MATTRFDYKCPMCKATCLDVRAPIGFPPEIVCGNCQEPMVRYFGATQEVTLNLGFRESRYGTEVDANIAKFQFQNL